MLQASEHQNLTSNVPQTSGDIEAAVVDDSDEECKNAPPHEEWDIALLHEESSNADQETGVVQEDAVFDEKPNDIPDQRYLRS